MGNHRDYGACSKHYGDMRPDFTPGALTFCCSCPHPIIFSFKILERGEGLRAVLDVLISRFERLPRLIVYDFACGLFRSAQHTLWWAVKEKTVVSNRFHVDNRTCHRGFHPDSYQSLNGRNTVSREKRNRPIVRMKETLRNCSQTVYTSLLASHTLYLNLQAVIRKETDAAVARRALGPISCQRREASANAHDDNRVEEALPTRDEVQHWYFKRLGLLLINMLIMTKEPF